jgi:hypothetical protein
MRKSEHKLKKYLINYDLFCDLNLFYTLSKLNAENHAKHRALHSRKKEFHSIEQIWDYKNQCKFCECQWLLSTTKAGRKKCCNNGAYLKLDTFPKLLPLPDIFKCLLMERTKHMSPNSAMYNKMFSIATIGIDNGRGDKYEPIMGDSCVTLNGQIYSYLPRARDTGKMSGL